MVAELAEQGFLARGFASVSDLMAGLASGQTPDLLVIDAELPEFTSDRWKAIRARAPAARTLLITGLLGSTLLADRVLRRPFSIGELAKRIKDMSGGPL